MPLGRRWLLVGVLGVALAAYWAGRLGPVWLPPPPPPVLPPLGRDEPAEPPPRRRRRIAQDTGRGRAVVLFGLPAAGRTALLVRTLLARPDCVTVPRPVTDRPPCAGDPRCELFEYVCPAQLQADSERGRFVEVRRRGRHLYATPLDCDEVVPGAAPLRLLKAPLAALPRLRELAAADATTTAADAATTAADDDDDDAATTTTTTTAADAATTTTTAADATTITTAAADATTTGAAAAAGRPLLVFVEVTERSEQTARLLLRDELPPHIAEDRLHAAEVELVTALGGAPLRCCFDVVLTNDDLDWAADALVGLIDAQLGCAPDQLGRAGSQPGRAESMMHSARQLWATADAGEERAG